uniref:Uncharacterized protein n=1 Tax=Tetranychus urticae TaxID=32264 RepID=T1KQ83_TETUR
MQEMTKNITKQSEEEEFKDPANAIKIDAKLIFIRNKVLSFQFINLDLNKLPSG